MSMTFERMLLNSALVLKNAYLVQLMYFNDNYNLYFALHAKIQLHRLPLPKSAAVVLF